MKMLQRRGGGSFELSERARLELSHMDELYLGTLYGDLTLHPVLLEKVLRVWLRRQRGSGTVESLEDGSYKLSVPFDSRQDHMHTAFVSPQAVERNWDTDGGYLVPCYREPTLRGESLFIRELFNASLEEVLLANDLRRQMQQAVHQSFLVRPLVGFPRTCTVSYRRNETQFLKLIIG